MADNRKRPTGPQLRYLLTAYGPHRSEHSYGRTDLPHGPTWRVNDSCQAAGWIDARGYVTPAGREIVAPCITRAMIDHAHSLALEGVHRGPGVRLTGGARTSDGESARSFRALFQSESRDVPDSHVLQLLALLDAGATLTRRFHRSWKVAGQPFSLSREELDRAVSAAWIWGMLVMEQAPNGCSAKAEPIHYVSELVSGTTHCSRMLMSWPRYRVTFLPSRVTCEKCRRA